MNRLSAREQHELSSVYPLFDSYPSGAQQAISLAPLESVFMPLTGKLPDIVYDCIRQAPKTSLHLHTKGSTPIILSLFDQLSRSRGSALLLSGEMLEQPLSIDGQNNFQKDPESRELRVKNYSRFNLYRNSYRGLTNIAKTPEGALLTYYILLQELASHHVRYVEFRTGIPRIFFHDLGLLVTVNPDNMVISKTDPTNEYVKLFQARLGSISGSSGLPINEKMIQTYLPEFILFMEAPIETGLKPALYLMTRENANR